MNNVEFAFKCIYYGSKLSIGFKKIACNLIFDVKFDLTIKDKYIGYGHLM